MKMPFLDNRQSTTIQAKLIHSMSILPFMSDISQLKISYLSGRFKNREELVTALYALYDESVHETIDALICYYENPTSRAMFASQVFDFVIDNLRRKGYSPNYQMVTMPSSSIHGPMLPDKIHRRAETDPEKARSTFNFSSVTLGRLTLMQGRTRISFQDRQLDAQFHAEDGLIEQMVEFIRKNEVDTTDIKVNLTINNFFCSYSSTRKHKKENNCLEEIIALQDKYHFARFHVYFQNTYGDASQMTEHIKELQRHGILVTAFTSSEKPPYINEILDSESESDDEFQQMEEDEEEAESLVMHKSVLSEADRIGASECYEIGFADGTDKNCSIISIFAAAGIKIIKEDAINYREALGIAPGIDIDLTPEVATKILNIITAITHQTYVLYVIYENTDHRHEVGEHATNGGGVPLFIFFAGTHFSPARHK